MSRLQTEMKSARIRNNETIKKLNEQGDKLWFKGWRKQAQIAYRKAQRVRRRALKRGIKVD